MSSIKKIKYYLQFQEELKLELDKHNFEGQGSEALKYYNNKVEKSVSKYISNYKGNTNKLSSIFISEEFKGSIQRAFLKISKSPREEMDYITQEQLDNFTRIIHNLQSVVGDKTLDYLSICMGYNGYIDFCTIKESEVKKDKGKITHPMKDAELKDFFRYPCYVYAYDDERNKPNEKTIPKKILNSNLDAHILDWDKDNMIFKLLKPTGERHHEKGAITWCNDKMNSFEIRFENSHRSLELRIDFNYNEEDKFEILLGAFILTYPTGAIATGSVILRKKKKVGKLPYKRNKTDQSKNTPSEILEYFVSRKYNWHKVPPKIHNLDGLGQWLDKQNRKDYTRQRVVKYKYLIMYPLTAFKDKTLAISLHNEILNAITDFGNETPSTVEMEFLKATNEKEYEFELKTMNDFIAEYRDKILVYPDKSFDFLKPDRSNTKEVFELISQSKNIIIILPKAKYKKTSSMYTVAGFCMALKRSVFIFHQSKSSLPNNLKRSDKELGLYVKNYKNLKEIPLFIKESDKYKREWRKYLEEKRGEKA